VTGIDADNPSYWKNDLVDNISEEEKWRGIFIMTGIPVLMDNSVRLRLGIILRNGKTANNYIVLGLWGVAWMGDGFFYTIIPLPAPVIYQ